MVNSKIKKFIDNAINRTSKKEEKLREDIINTLKNSQRPLSTAEIASILGLPWHSVQTRCLRLQVEDRVGGFRSGRMNLWTMKIEK